MLGLGGLLSAYRGISSRKREAGKIEYKVGREAVYILHRRRR